MTEIGFWLRKCFPNDETHLLLEKPLIVETMETELIPNMFTVS
jgi:hypothetical protein